MYDGKCRMIPTHQRIDIRRRVSAIASPQVLEKIVFLGIVIIGIFLRFYRVFDFLSWNDDSGRDLLVAKHIVEYGGSWRLSPPPAGTTLIANTPLYYWIISILYFFTRSVAAVLVFSMVMNTLAIVGAYIVGKLLKSTFVALSFSACISFGYIFILPAKTILQPNIINAIVVACLILYLFLHNRQSVFVGLLLITMMFAGIAIHLSFLPPFVCLTLAILYEIIRSDKLKNSLVLFSAYYILLFLWIFTYVRIGETVARSTSLAMPQWEEVFARISSGAKEFGFYIFLGAGHIAEAIFVIIFFGAVAATGLFRRRQFGFPAKFLLFVSLWMFTIFFVWLAYGNGVPYYYYSGYYAIAFLGIVMFLDIIPSFGIKTMAACLLIALISTGTLAYIRKVPGGEFSAAKTVAAFVLSDYHSRSRDKTDALPDFWIVAADGLYPGVFGMFSEYYWYGLENMTGKKLTEVVDGPRNSKPVVENPRYIYVSCREAEGGYRSKDECITAMEQKYPHDFGRYHTRVFLRSIAAHPLKFHVFRYERPD